MKTNKLPASHRLCSSHIPSLLDELEPRLLLSGVQPATATAASVYGFNQGGQSYGYIDKDNDGYGVGMTADGRHLQSDADDSDPSVTTFASAKAKYGTVAGLLDHLGYHPTRIFYVDPNYYRPGDPYTPNPCAPGTDISSPALYHPYKTWEDIAHSEYTPSPLLAGDAVIYRQGTYDGHGDDNIWIQQANGTQSNPILIMGMPGETVTLTNGNRGIWFGGDNENRSQHLVLDNFTITQTSGSAGVAIHHASDVLVKNMEVYNAGSWGVIATYDLTSITLDSLVLHEEGEHGIYVGCTDDDVAQDTTITNNLVYGNLQNGIHLNQRVERTLINDNVLFANERGIEFDDGVRDAVVANNTIVNNSQNQIVLYQYDAVARGRDDMHGGDIYNIVFANNTIVGDSGIKVSNEGVGQAVGMDIRDVTFANNVIQVSDRVLLFYDDTYTTGGSIAFGYADSIYFENNLVDSPKSAGDVVMEDNQTVSHGWSFNAWQNTHSQVAWGNVCDNAGFVNSTLQDYNLTNTSHARDLGLLPDEMRLSLCTASTQALNTAVGTDALGVARTYAIDAGAYQFPSVGDTTGPHIVSTQINNGHAERSAIAQIGVTFSEPVAKRTCSMDLRRYDPGSRTWVAVNTSGAAFAYDTATSTAVWDLWSGTDMGKYMPSGWYAARVQATDLAGNSLAGNSTIMVPWLRGDADGNQKVDFNDYLILEANFGTIGDPKSYSPGDMDLDGAVNFSDYLTLEANFGTALGAPPAL